MTKTRTEQLETETTLGLGFVILRDQLVVYEHCLKFASEKDKPKLTREVYQLKKALEILKLHDRPLLEKYKKIF